MTPEPAEQLHHRQVDLAVTPVHGRVDQPVAPVQSTSRLPAHRSPWSSAGGSAGPHARRPAPRRARRGRAPPVEPPELDGPARQRAEPPLDEELGPVVGRREVDGLRAEVPTGASSSPPKCGPVTRWRAASRAPRRPRSRVRRPTSIHSSTRPDGRSRTTSGTATAPAAAGPAARPPRARTAPAGSGWVLANSGPSACRAGSLGDVAAVTGARRDVQPVDELSGRRRHARRRATRAARLVEDVEHLA